MTIEFDNGPLFWTLSSGHCDDTKYIETSFVWNLFHAHNLAPSPFGASNCVTKQRSGGCWVGRQIRIRFNSIVADILATLVRSTSKPLTNSHNPKTLFSSYMSLETKSRDCAAHARIHIPSQSQLSLLARSSLARHLGHNRANGEKRETIASAAGSLLLLYSTQRQSRQTCELCKMLANSELYDIY